MIQGRDILVTGLQSLDSSIGSNCVNLAYEFAKNNRILYVNYALDRMTLLRAKNNPLIQKRKRIIKGEEPDLVKVQDNLWNLNPRVVLESINQINPPFLFDWLNKRNAGKVAKAMNKALKELDFKDFIVFNDSDFYRCYYLQEQIHPKTFVYYTRDNMITTDYFRKHGYRYESRMMKKADAVVANSVYLRDLAAKHNPNSVYVGQGCDLEMFSKEYVKEIPEDLKSIKKPLIGYIGALKSSRLDIDLLEYISKTRPDWSVVLVGPEDEVFKQSNLHNIENVHFLGSKKIEELPTYTYYFDVAMNPQALNELTIGNYPRKIDEYLAIGVPTLGTKTQAMSVFADHVYLAGDKEDYIVKIEQALKENSEELSKKRIEFARSHSWENNVKEIYKVIEETENSN